MTISFKANGDGTSGAISVNSNEVIKFDQNGILVGDRFSFRNRIINGNFDINQRGTTAFPIGNTYGIDRWFAGVAGAAITGGLTWLPTPYAPNGAAYFQLNGAASNTSALLAQRIESINIRDLAGKKVTVSYWIYQSTGSAKNITTMISSANTVDNFSAQTTVDTSSSVSIPDSTWTKVTWTTTLNAACVNGIQLTLGSGIGPLLAGKVLAIGRVQLEAGEIATDFEVRQHSVEIVLCQRYYEVVFHRFTGVTYKDNGDSRCPPVFFKVMKRTNPTVSGVQSLNVIAVSNSGAGANLGGTCDAFSMSTLSCLLTTMGNSVNIANAIGGSTVFSWGCSNGMTLHFNAEL